MPTSPTLTDSPAQRQRVQRKIADVILDFHCWRMAANRPVFHSGDLHVLVAKQHSIAPSSTDRILRLLRQQGKLDYEVLSRRQSLYRFVPVGQGELLWKGCE